VLAELRGDGAHPHTFADLDRGADVRDLAVTVSSSDIDTPSGCVASG
jgi:hypothetical protein